MVSPDSPQGKGRRSTGSYGLLQGLEDLLDAEDDEQVQAAVDEADVSQAEIDALRRRCSDETAIVERRFNNLKRQHYERRNDALRRIPNFWITTFLNHSTMGGLIKETEEARCLSYLASLTVEDLPGDDVGYAFTLGFKENPYLSNKELCKKVWVEDGVLRTEATHVAWEEGSPPFSETLGFFGWFSGVGDVEQKAVTVALAEDVWVNPLKYYLRPDITVWDSHQCLDPLESLDDVECVDDDDDVERC